MIGRKTASDQEKRVTWIPLLTRGASPYVAARLLDGAEVAAVATAHPDHEESPHYNDGVLKPAHTAKGEYEAVRRSAIWLRPKGQNVAHASADMNRHGWSPSVRGRHCN